MSWLSPMGLEERYRSAAIVPWPIQCSLQPIYSHACCSTAGIHALFRKHSHAFDPMQRHASAILHDISWHEGQ